MKKNNQIDQKRIKIIVKLFIDSEIERYKHQSQQFGLVRKYFRFVHLGNRIIHKISATKNTTFILKSLYEDLEIKVIKGTGNLVTTVTIINNELCWENV